MTYRHTVYLYMVPLHIIILIRYGNDNNLKYATEGVKCGWCADGTAQDKEGEHTKKLARSVCVYVCVRAHYTTASHYNLCVFMCVCVCVHCTAPQTCVREQSSPGVVHQQVDQSRGQRQAHREVNSPPAGSPPCLCGGVSPACACNATPHCEGIPKAVVHGTDSLGTWYRQPWYVVPIAMVHGTDRLGMWYRQPWYMVPTAVVHGTDSHGTWYSRDGL